MDIPRPSLGKTPFWFRHRFLIIICLDFLIAGALIFGAVKLVQLVQKQGLKNIVHEVWEGENKQL